MDAFYPAVEVLDNPELRGKPVIVGGSRKRGVVSSASYEARKFGVHSAQPMATAMRLCPDGIYMPVRMSRYQEVSRQIFEIFHRFTPLVEVHRRHVTRKRCKNHPALNRWVSEKNGPVISKARCKREKPNNRRSSKHGTRHCPDRQSTVTPSGTNSGQQEYSD